MITVVGIGAGPLPEDVRALVDGGALVVGAPRHLERAGARDGVKLGDLGSALTAIEACAGDVVLLASGDPGFFGIVRALAERFGRERLQVIPGVSSVAAAFARAGLPWDDAIVVSAHGRDPRPAINACLAHPKVAVLTAPDFGPADLAPLLAGSGRRMLVAERLGEDDERVVEGAAEEIAAGRWRDPNVVVVLDEQSMVGARGTAWPARRTPERWALPEEAFEHRDGMITKREVRALSIARLGPGMGDLVWDVGAGSGSVAIECARLGAAAIAVERDPRACTTIERNAHRHDVSIKVVQGEAPEALETLPDPDAVYVGGTGAAFEPILKLAAARTRRAAVVALAGLDRVGLGWELLASGGLRVDAVLVQAARLRALGDAHRLAPINPVFLLVGERP